MVHTVTDTAAAVDEDLDSGIRSGAGDIFVSEIMANPDVVSDLDGEWFELYNPQSRSFSLRGCRFTGTDGDAFEIESDVTIGPWSRVVFGVNGSMDENGGAEVDVVYDRLDFSLDNFEDQIRMVNASGVTVSTVNYNRDWIGSRVAVFSWIVRVISSLWQAALPVVLGIGDVEGVGAHTVNEACLISDWDDDGFTEEAGDCDDDLTFSGC